MVRENVEAQLNGVESEVSIQLEFIRIVFHQAGILLSLVQHDIADGQHVEPGAHEAAERVSRCADDGLAPDVEGRIDHHRTFCESIEFRDQRIVVRIGVWMNCLDAC